ncbi:MAG TPA: hypothetical protein VJN93_05425 [Candidatus Acidoferrum sp.]|nr:hypothetical protein [Candidatus Acidoferrum sp.]
MDDVGLLPVSELSGRAVSYAYDSIYRLTNETISSDPHGINGAVGCTYDPVGSRTQMTSSLAKCGRVENEVAGLFHPDVGPSFSPSSGRTHEHTQCSGGKMRFAFCDWLGSGEHRNVRSVHS